MYNVNVIRTVVVVRRILLPTVIYRVGYPVQIGMYRVSDALLHPLSTSSSLSMIMVFFSFQACFNIA